jgi:hypothetical protein
MVPQVFETPKRVDDNLVWVPRVRAVSNRLALICELPSTRRVGVPLHLIDAQSEVRLPGDYGTLVIPRQLAEDLGLRI